MAQMGDPASFTLPRPLKHSGDLDFSFAGLKTAVRTQVIKLGDSPCDQVRADLAASTQAAIVDVLVHKSVAALKATGLRRLVIAGGVGANTRLREQLGAACAELDARLHYPEPALCTDNGAMIALAAAMRWQAGLVDETESGRFDVKPRWPLDELSAGIAA
jgi:N6-L-threonylcarbamoyladenine synthase